MNILFILGNGFDINLGMDTRYTDFYKYYNSLPSKSELIFNLKKSISVDITNWSDLEIALGEYTVNLKNLKEFDEVFDDIIDNLSDYLQIQEDKFVYDKIDTKAIYDYLCKPEQSLLKADEEIIGDFKNKWANYQWNINIVTLNYTLIIEKLLNEKYKNLLIGTHHSNAPIYLNNVEHVHGYLNERMIIGVNDLSQLKNNEFKDNRDIIEAIIKSNCNQIQKHNVDKVFKNHILSANLICLFGSSIGDTDKIWWEMVGEQLTKDCNLIIFDKYDEIPLRKGFKIGRRERAIKDFFLSKTNLDNEVKEKVKDQIFVGVNSSMFKYVWKE